MKTKAGAKRKAQAKTSREKVRSYRARMRAKGMRLVQIWVPDTRSPEFAAEARRQSKLIAKSSRSKDDQAFIDAVADDVLADIETAE
jgi:hypothetical protein